MSSKRNCPEPSDVSPKRTKTAHIHRTGFLDLPAELRLSIYEMCLSTWKAIDVRRMASPTTLQRPWKRLNLSPALLRTCRQIFEEGEDVLYAANSFVIFVHPRPSIAFVYDSIGFYGLPRPTEETVRPIFSPRCKSIQRLQIVFASWGPEIHSLGQDHLLDDLCAASMGSGSELKMLCITERRYSSASGTGKAWQAAIDIDNRMSIDVVGLALRHHVPSTIVIDAKDQQRFAQIHRQFSKHDIHVSNRASMKGRADPFPAYY